MFGQLMSPQVLTEIYLSTCTDHFFTVARWWKVVFGFITKKLPRKRMTGSMSGGSVLCSGPLRLAITLLGTVSLRHFDLCIRAHHVSCAHDQ